MPQPLRIRLFLSAACFCTAFALLACGDDATRPEFAGVGTLQGSVQMLGAEGVGGVLVRRHEGANVGTTGAEWLVELGESGVFELPLPTGHYSVRLAPSESNLFRGFYLTPFGNASYLEGPSYLWEVDAALPATTVRGALGRIRMRAALPATAEGIWRLELEGGDDRIIIFRGDHDLGRTAPAENGLGAGAPAFGWSDDAESRALGGEVLFVLPHVPFLDYATELESPFDEDVPHYFMLDSLASETVYPDSVGIQEYEIVLPDPTQFELRSTLAYDVERFSVTVRAVALDGTRIASARLGRGLDDLPKTTLPIFSQRPLRLELDWNGVGVPLGDPAAPIFEPAPGQEIDVDVPLGAVVCTLPLDPGTPDRIELIDAGTGRRLDSQRLTVATGRRTATLVAPPGRYQLLYTAASWTVYGPQFYGESLEAGEPLAVEVRSGEEAIIAWTLRTGATIRGKLRHEWEPGDEFYVRDERTGASWYVTPASPPDGRDFVLENVPNGYLVLGHDRTGGVLYYPGVRQYQLATVLHVTGFQDLDGVDFRR